MISEEIGDLLPAIGAVTPEKGNGSRYSAVLTNPFSGGWKEGGVPNYLRASTGSCHDLCKFGRKHETETKPWAAGRGRRIDRKPPEKIVTADEGFLDRKNYMKAKGQLSDSSHAVKEKMPSSEKRKLGSNVSISKAPSKLKSSATPSRLFDPGRIDRERVSPDVEGSKQVLVKVTERRILLVLVIRSGTKTATTRPTSSSKSLASPCPKSNDRKAAAENAGFSNRIRVRNAAIALTSSIPTKSSASSAQTSAKRKLWKPKTLIGQKNQKMDKDYRIQRIEVPEKTLYVIGVESNNEGKSLDLSAISVENELPESEENGIISEHPRSPWPSQSVAESLSQRYSSTHEEGKGGMENSCIQYSCQEEEEEEGEGEYDDHDEDDEEEVGSEYSDGESETFSDSESDETQIKEEELIMSSADGVRRRPREALVRVHPEGADGKPVKLKFRRGRVVEIQPDNNTPKRLKFRRRKSPGEDEARTHPQRRVPKKRGVTANPNYSSNPSSEKYALRSSSVPEKDGQGALFNNVIEATASKLVETRKSKVKALVGAFETGSPQRPTPARSEVVICSNSRFRDHLPPCGDPFYSRVYILFLFPKRRAFSIFLWSSFAILGLGCVMFLYILVLIKFYPRNYLGYLFSCVW